ncbi:MerR-like DNA binding protein [Propionicimonas paludicola]|uniref:MerR-like DNA binding protein n=1 Tax=Propionicimonas paludicola TaxID=185243 RepID=A0A2A9CNB0_9ACTN|nr:MerR family transcriptional regulator [Propionicimonas paludicola]PFG15575.1 MerR-like DNA binding protein [Propionicimonas paludicola]
MKISELSDRSGVPIATIKFYLREGLLAPGAALNARESAYDETHLRRLRVIRGLVQVTGASIEQVRQLMAIIEMPGQSAIEVVGRASTALSARQAAASGTPDTQEAEGLLTRLGVSFAAESENLRLLASALELAGQVGLSPSDDQLAVYVQAAREVARADFARVPWDDPQQAAEWAVLGTALYEPISSALRRLAHSELAGRLDQAHPEATPDR